MDIDLKNCTEEEYRKYFFQSKYYKSLGLFRYILTWIGVSQYKFIKEPFGWRERQRINPYNPLSYLVILVLLIITPIIHIIKYTPEIIQEIWGAFKYK